MRGGCLDPRRCRALWVLLLPVLAVLALASPASADDSPGTPRTFEEVAQLFGVADQPADFVVVVDVSSSMGKGPAGETPWDVVERSYASLVGSLRPFDHLSVVAFARGAALVFSGTLEGDGAEQQAERALAPFPLGSGGSGRPSEISAGTDIGAGLALGLDELDRVGAAEVQTLVLLTDGRFAAPGSPYEGRGSEAWQDLAQQAAELESQGHRISAYAVGLSPVTDAGLVVDVFPDAAVLSIPDEQLPDYFADLVLQARREQVRPLVEADIARPVVATLAADGDLAPTMDARVVITSNRQELDTQVEVRSITVTTAEGEAAGVSAELPARFVLAPGQSVEIPVVLDVPGVESGPRLGVSRQQSQLAVTVDATTVPTAVKTLDANDLATVQQSTGTVVSGPSTTVAAARGIPWWVLAATVAALVLLALLARFLYVRLWKLPPLVGVLEDRSGAVLATLAGTALVVPTAQAPLGDTRDDRVAFTTKRRRRGLVWASAAQGEPELDRGDGWEPLGQVAVRLVGGDRIRLGKQDVTYQSTTQQGAGR